MNTLSGKNGATEAILPPKELTELFTYVDKQYIKDEIEKIEDLEEGKKKEYFQAITEYLGKTEGDMPRSWCTSALRWVGNKEAYMEVLELIQGRGQATEGRSDKRYTVYYALKATHDMKEILNSQEKDELYKKYKEIADGAKNKEDNYWVCACKALFVSEKLDENKIYQNDLETIIKEVSIKEASWESVKLLRVFREFPVLDFQRKICDLAKDTKQFSDTRVKMIEALGEYGEGINLESVKCLGELLNARDCDRQIRLGAAISLKRLHMGDSTKYLIEAIEKDWDAEIRNQAVDALKKTRGSANAVRVLIDKVLDKEIVPLSIPYLTDAIRRIDDGGDAPSYLDLETSSLDAERASRAQKVLIQLGGIESVSRLMARKKVINNIDVLLASSEEVVRDDHKEIMKRAMSNFGFALAVNIVIVAIGVALTAFGIYKMFTDASNIAMWLPVSGGGLILTIVQNFLKDPKDMAKKDLATLVTVNVIFLGFLRQVHEIDATFKHAYLEDDFSIDDMDKTVNKLNDTMTKTLTDVNKYLDMKPVPKPQ